jgi:superfamily I DNA and RNA helicase
MDNISLRIYSSLKPGAYTVRPTEINEEGAFIQTEHLPEDNEIITFEILDENQKSLYMDDAVVNFIKKDTSRKNRGFYISFRNQLNIRV